MDQAVAPPVQAPAEPAPQAEVVPMYPDAASPPPAYAQPSSPGYPPPADAYTDAYGYMADAPYVSATVNPSGVQVAAGTTVPGGQLDGEGHAILGPNGPEAGVSTTVVTQPVPGLVAQAGAGANTTTGVGAGASVQAGPADGTHVTAAVAANPQGTTAGVNAQLGDAQNGVAGSAALTNGTPSGNVTAALTTEQLRARAAGGVDGQGIGNANAAVQAGNADGTGPQVQVAADASQLGTTHPNVGVNGAAQLPLGDDYHLDASGGANDLAGPHPSGYVDVNLLHGDPGAPGVTASLGADGLGTPEAQAQARLAARAPLSENVDLMVDAQGATGPGGSQGQATAGVEARPADGVTVQISGGVTADSHGGVGGTAQAGVGGTF